MYEWLRGRPKIHPMFDKGHAGGPLGLGGRERGKCRNSNLGRYLCRRDIEAPYSGYVSCLGEISQSPDGISGVKRLTL